jgi:hypothetical protein
MVSTSGAGEWSRFADARATELRLFDDSQRAISTPSAAVTRQREGRDRAEYRAVLAVLEAAIKQQGFIRKSVYPLMVMPRPGARRPVVVYYKLEQLTVPPPMVGLTKRAEDRARRADAWLEEPKVTASQESPCLTEPEPHSQLTLGHVRLRYQEPEPPQGVTRKELREWKTARAAEVAEREAALALVTAVDPASDGLLQFSRATNPWDDADTILGPVRPSLIWKACPLHAR